MFRYLEKLTPISLHKDMSFVSSIMVNVISVTEKVSYQGIGTFWGYLKRKLALKEIFVKRDCSQLRRECRQKQSSNGSGK